MMKIVTAKAYQSQSYNSSQYLDIRVQTKVYHTNYNLMIKTHTCLSLVLLLFVLANTIASYRVTSGSDTTSASAVNFITKGKSPANVNITSFYKFFIFPYDVYEYHANDTANLIYSHNFIFLKNNFSYIQPLMNTQNSTLELQDQFQILYSRIPEVIHIVGDNGQLLQIELIDANNECKQFLIKNSSLDKIENGVRIYDLNFYYMQVNKYLLKVMNVAYYKTSQNSNATRLQATAAWLQDLQLSKFQASKGKSLLQLKKHKFVVENILKNDTFWESEDFTNYLIYRVFTRRIKQHTKWKAIYDGFSIKYFSAQIQKMTKVDSLTSESEIQLTSFQVGEGEIKQSKVIKQPLKYIKMVQIQFLEMCRWGQKVSVLFGDKNLTYVVDITKDEWHLLQLIRLANSSELILPFFGKSCNAFVLKRKTIKVERNETQKNETHQSETKQNEVAIIFQYFPIKEKNIKMIKKVVSHYFKPSIDYLVVCDEKNNCTLLQTFGFKEANALLNKSELVISREQTVSFHIGLLQNEMKYLLQIFDLKQKKQQLFIFQTSNSNNAITPSLAFLHPIYNSLIYRNKTQYIGNEMNRQIYQHIKQASFLQSEKQKQLYFEQIFHKKLVQDKCLVPFEFISTVAEVKFIDNQQWVVCVWQHQINQYTQLFLTFKERYLNYQLYLCASFLQLFSDRMNIQCVTLLDQQGQLSETKTKSFTRPLRSNHFYKLYIVKHNQAQQKYLPTIFVKDVQRQQIQVASTVFFFIMIVLSLLLLGLVLFITLKSVIINLLIYYGLVNQRVEPTYPLAWFPLKTKLKRMRQHGILRFVQYQPSLSDTQGNHCCFCLQFIKQRAVVAQIYCGHQFHKQCFRQWIKNEPNAKCPTCRRLFTRSALLEYQTQCNHSSQSQIPL